MWNQSGKKKRCHIVLHYINAFVPTFCCTPCHFQTLDSPHSPFPPPLLRTQRIPSSLLSNCLLIRYENVQVHRKAPARRTRRGIISLASTGIQTMLPVYKIIMNWVAITIARDLRHQPHWYVSPMKSSDWNGYETWCSAKDRQYNKYRARYHGFTLSPSVM